MRKYSVAIHDLRVSDNESAALVITKLINKLNVPLTVHLVFDRHLDESPELKRFLHSMINEHKIELVFHGLTHTCSRKTHQLLSFYHNYQAEYLEDNMLHLEESRKTFINLKEQFNTNLGICPPCWLILRKFEKSFEELNPLYVEHLIRLRYNKNNVYSPAISLGSPNDKDLLLLKILDKIIYYVFSWVPNVKIRVAFHVCDLEKGSSSDFLNSIINKLKKRRYEATFLKHFC